MDEPSPVNAQAKAAARRLYADTLAAYRLDVQQREIVLMALELAYLRGRSNGLEVSKAALLARLRDVAGE